jgi:hypothetical protein
VLGIAPGGHRRRAAEVALGVAVGIGVADLLIRLIGSGAVQLAVVVLLAAGAVVLLGGGPLVAAQAASSAVLVAALPTSGAVPYRFIDALVGGLVGLAVLIAVPRNPLSALRSVDPLLAELAAVLEDIALALDRRDPQAASRTLERARATTALADSFHQVLAGARETAVLAPTQWRSQGTSSVTPAPRSMWTTPCATCVCSRGLQSELARESSGFAGIEATLGAVGRATRVLEGRPSLAVNVMIGQVRSLAADLLGAFGIERHEAVRHIRAAVRQVR